MARSTEQLIYSLLNGIPLEGGFDSSQVHWGTVVRKFERWQILPLLRGRLTTEQMEKIPEGTRLLLQEREARSRLLRTGLRHELDLLLKAFQQADVPVILLGTAALRFLFEIDVPTESVLLELSALNSTRALEVLGKKGYRATEVRSGHYVELRHRCSYHRIRVHLDFDADHWSRSERVALSRISVLRPGREDLAQWLRKNVDLSRSPRDLIRLAALEPKAKELKKLELMENFERWLLDYPAKTRLSPVERLILNWRRRLTFGAKDEALR